MLLLLILVLSFVPVIPIWSFYGFDEKHKAIEYIKYHAYYEGFSIFSNPKDFLDFLFLFGFFGSFIFLVLAIVLVFLRKWLVAKIFLLVNTVLFTIVGFSPSIVSSYAGVSTFASVALLIIDFVMDYQSKQINKRKEETKKMGELIKSKRVEKQLTQEELADLVNISRSLIAKFEIGASLPNEKQMGKIGKTLGFDEEIVNKCWKNEYEKEEYKTHYLITLAVTIFALVLSVLPILPISVYLGLEGKKIPIYTTQVDAYYLYFYSLLIKGEVSSFFFALGMIGFYVSAFLVVLFIFLADYRKVKTCLVVCSISHILGIVTLSYISIFSTICLTAFLSLFIVDFSIDQNSKLKNQSALERKRELMVFLGQKIREGRNNKGLTQQQLADKIFVSRSLITKFEIGTNMPSEKQLEDLSIVLDIDLSIDDSK